MVTRLLIQRFLQMLLNINEIHFSHHAQEGSKLMAANSLGIATLSFFEIDDLPDGFEVLRDHQISEKEKRQYIIRTHVSLNVEVLQVKGVLPNVNADDGNVRKERILVGSGDYFQFSGARIIALTNHGKVDLIGIKPEK